MRTLFRRPGRNEEFFEELEDTLVEGDIGPAAAQEIIAALRADRRLEGEEELMTALRRLLAGYVRAERLTLEEPGPNVFLVLGVNGVGKTTTIAKLAEHYRASSGTRVLLAAGDTFRAAAIDQLVVWGQRLGVPVVHQQPGADPAAVLFDAIASGRSRGCDLVLADTAGRLHNKAHLVGELAKIDRVVRSRLQEGSYRKLLVIDATTGQNALRQAEVFHEAVGVDSVILAKYDSTGRGGIVIPICRQLSLPFSFVGTGEKLSDLAVFDTDAFLDNLLARE
ncbi:MAG: signal recognition particle-docking protein FtsY [Spirochaetales bacterium]|nr:signal recognition particle-docking protein FtsY [Spirochaetales bacterium]